MKLSKLTVGDIMIQNLLYFDSKQSKSCKMVCRELKIDYLPDLDGIHRNKYLSNQDKFRKEVIPGSAKINIDMSILDPQCLEKFEHEPHNVLFVYDGELL